jgi:formyltetrahydrofolate synthetase
MTKEDKKFFNTKFKEEREYIDKRFDRIESRLDNLEEWTGIADKKFDLIEKKFVEVDNHFDKLEMYLATRFAEIEKKIDEFFEEIYYMRKVAELHTVKIGRLEVRYKNEDR